MADLDYVPVSRKSDLILLLSGILLFFAFLAFLDAGKALFCAMDVGVFISIIQTKPVRRKDRRFWSIIAVFALVHITALCFVRIPEPRFGLMFLPFALADGFVMWALIGWIERRFPVQ